VKTAARPRASGTGTPAIEATNAWAGAEAPFTNPGNNRQVVGACTIGVELGELIAAICIAIAQ
jgi:hypothetical protein